MTSKQIKTYEFDALMLTDGQHDWGYVEFPFDVQEEFGTRGQVKVIATFDGYEYRGSLVKMGHACHFIGITKPIRAAIGKNPGDQVHVVIRQDIEPRMVEVPEDMKQLLHDYPKAEAIFQKLSYTHKKEYVQWISGAKKQETRQKRLEETIEMLLKKVKEP
jgi:hypothetical protein